MENRTLTITLQADWKNALRAAAQAAQAPSYQGETLNFEQVHGPARSGKRFWRDGERQNDDAGKPSCSASCGPGGMR
jgi:hypothetical protein